MAHLNVDKLKTLIKEEIEKYDHDANFENVGFVLSVGDGICVCFGLEQAIMGEKVIFDSGAQGLVFNLEENQVGIILLGDIANVKERERVRTTGEIFDVPVGYNLLGRIIDPLGNPLDNLGKLVFDKKYPIERPAYEVLDRGPVNTPLETGITFIDALIPVGKGQRELIIGDRQTGKTSIAIDAILNQKGKNVKCIYVAIGQKESSVAQIASTLAQKGALEYTIIVSASASKEGTIQYLAPFAGASMAEYFMDKGDDVLIVYDDLSKHAVAYRELSLLLRRPPGREAYPGDVFYLHSRLLERAAKLNEKLGGGSITALPIIETKAGDISAYIPTNVISITDGQIFLETQLFYSGVRPAVNSGLSVSRVGGSAQTKAIKSVSGLLRIGLASYRELEQFSQFGSDLDISSQKKLQRGRKTIEILKQNIHELKSIPLQTIVLYSLNNGLLDDIEISNIKNFENLVKDGLLENSLGKELNAHILNKKTLPEKELIEKFIKEIKKVL